MLGRASATRSATGARAAARPVAAAQPPRSLHAPSALARRSRRPPDTSRRASRPPRTLAATPRGAPPAAAAGDAPPPGEEGGAAGELALIFVAVGVGLATGASFVAFNEAIHVLRDAVWGTEEFLTGRALLRTLTEAQLWPLVALPPIGGGLAVGALKLVVGGYADRAASSDDGTAERVRAAARPWARAAAAAVALGTGASLGPEGPIVDIGRSWAAGLGAALGGAPRRAALTSLLAAGAGAGVAAGFNAPIAGVFFAVETVLQREAFGGGADNSKDAPDGAGPARGDALASNGLTVAMVLLAAVVAASVVQAGLGSSPAFRVPEYRLESLGELPVFAAFGALCGAVSASFSYSTRVATDAFADIRAAAPVPAAAALLPAVGGLTTGVLALGYPEILYQGFDNINSVLASSGDYSAAPGLLLQILVVKIIATAICRGSGLQGGLYAPSIMMGAALGAAFGQAAHLVGDPAGLPLSEPQAYALVGVAAMLAANCGVPLTAVLLLFELTRDYLVIPPTLAAVGISYWISSAAAPGVRSAAARRRAAAAVAGRGDAALLEGWRGWLRAGAGRQDAAEAADGDAASATPAPADAAGGLLSGAGAGEALTLACASEAECLLVYEQDSLAEALAAMEADGRLVAVIIGREGGVVGMVSRDMAEAQRLYSDGDATSDAEGGGRGGRGGGD